MANLIEHARNSEQTEEGNTPWLWIAIVAAVIVLAVVLLPIFKKKKA